MSFFDAIRLGDANEVMRLLNTDPSLLEGANMLGDRMTPLIYAASAGQLEIVKLLTGKSADIHATTFRAQTALHCAAVRGHEEVVVYLLDKGAEPTFQDQTGNTPLMLAVRSGRPRVARRLLEQMGEGWLEARCQSRGHTALHIAVDCGHTELVAILLNHGARAHTTSKYGKSALQTAVDQGHVETVKLLVDRLGPQALHEVDPMRGSLLHIALGGFGRRSEKMTMYLLSKGACPTVANGHGATPLMCAAGWASIQVLRRVLEHAAGQGLNDRSSSGMTALHHAVFFDRPENVRALLLAGADPTIVDTRQRTPRMLTKQGTNRRRGAVHPSSVEVFKVRDWITHAVLTLKDALRALRRRRALSPNVVPVSPHPVCHVSCPS
jgi:ankyrin repeat protein